MISIKLFVSCASFIVIVHQIYGLEKLSFVKENDISVTADAVRNTSEDFLDRFQLKKVKDKPWFEQYATIHNHLLAVTKQDYNNLNEIAELVDLGDKKLDNVTEHYVTLINEILDEDPEPRLDDNEIMNYIDSILNKLHDFRNLSKDVDVNLELVKQFYHDSFENEIRNSYNDTKLEEPDYWTEIPNTRRIYKGDRTKIKHYPFMAGVQYFDVFQCAGSIISSDLVLTAASCVQLAHNNRFFRENPIFLSVHVGSSFYRGGGEVIPIMEVYFHPSYVPKTLVNNICLLRLQRHLKFKKRKVMRIDIDRKPASLPINVPKITVLGWGAKSLANSLKDPWENILSSAVLDNYPLMECQDIYGKEYVTHQHFCAGFMSKGGGACNHDVGGPGIVDGLLTGIISFGSPQCGAVDAPTVFVKVGFYAVWIDTIIEQSKNAPKAAIKTTLKPETLNTPAPYGFTHLTTFVITPFIMTTTGRPMIMEETDTEEEKALRKKKPKITRQSIKSQSEEAREFEELMASNSFVQKLMKQISGSDDPNQVLNSIKDVAKKDNNKLIGRDITHRDSTTAEPVTTDNYENESEKLVTNKGDNESNEPRQIVTGLVDFDPGYEKHTTEKERPSTQPLSDVDANKWVDISSDYSIDGEDELKEILKSKVPVATTQKVTKIAKKAHAKRQKYLTDVENAVAPSFDPDATHKTNPSDVNVDLHNEMLKVVDAIDLGELLQEANKNEKTPKEALNKDLEQEMLSMLYLTDNENNKDEPDFDSLEKMDVKSAISNALMDIVDTVKSNETTDDTVSLPRNILYELLADAVIAKTQNKTVEN